MFSACILSRQLGWSPACLTSDMAASTALLYETLSVFLPVQKVNIAIRKSLRGGRAAGLCRATQEHTEVVSGQIDVERKVAD